MQDIQNTPAQVLFPINTVGIRGLKFPIQVQTQYSEIQETVSVIDIGVELPIAFRGTHMSRFIELLQEWNKPLSYESLKNLLRHVEGKLQAQSADIAFLFPYFLKKTAPATGVISLMSYDCKVVGKSNNGNIDVFFEITVPVMTVCPCSKAISHEGAHSQRTEIYIEMRLNSSWIVEDIIEMAESSASSPLYSILKRADEKFITELAFANPTFVEDVVRNMASKLKNYHNASGFRIEVESFESIHAHNAFACIEHQFVAH